MKPTTTRTFPREGNCSKGNDVLMAMGNDCCAREAKIAGKEARASEHRSRTANVSFILENGDWVLAGRFCSEVQALSSFKTAKPRQGRAGVAHTVFQFLENKMRK